MPAPPRQDAGTASQLIPGVGRTYGRPIEPRTVKGATLPPTERIVARAFGAVWFALRSRAVAPQCPGWKPTGQTDGWFTDDAQRTAFPSGGRVGRSVRNGRGLHPRSGRRWLQVEPESHPLGVAFSVACIDRSCLTAFG
jgi:hypothetical protein